MERVLTLLVERLPDGRVDVAVVVTPWLAWLRRSDNLDSPQMHEGAVRARVSPSMIPLFLPLLDHTDLFWRLCDEAPIPGDCPRLALRAVLAADAGDEETARRDADALEREDPELAEWVRSSIRSRPRAVAVVVRGPPVLVIKRHFRGRDYAVLPGGGVEEGETFEEAATRELWEESTMRGRIDRELFAGAHRGRQARYFLMTEVTGEPVLSGPELLEHSPENSFELMWATPGQFEPLNLVPPHLRDDLPRALPQLGAPPLP